MTDKPFFHYGSGDTNLIISAPHAGYWKPEFIPDRTYGIKLADTHSGSIARFMLKEFKVKPYYIFANVHRSKIDFNRGVKEGAQGDITATTIWRSWHNTIRLFINQIPYGLYVEIHSHNNSDEFQLGYDLSKYHYLKLLKNPELNFKSSLSPLGTDLHGMLFGEYSLKAALESLGYKIYMPKSSKEVYFSGGYGIEVHHKNGFGAIQIEIPVGIAKGNEKQIAKDLVKSIDIFRKKFVGGLK